MSNKHVHLMLATNSGFLQHVGVCLVSLLANNPDLLFDIVIVAQAGEVLDRDRLRRSLAKFPNQSLWFCEFKAPADVALLTTDFYTIETWARLWVAEFFAPEVERVLYLDGDTVIVDSIAPLWHSDLEGALLGAVDIPGSVAAERLGLPADRGYFNAGVLVIDLAQWRETGAMQTVLDFVGEHPEQIRTVDQDALNACFHSRRKPLDYTWNVIRPFFREPPALPLPRAEIERVRRGARIIHFNGASKPWSYFCDHPRKDEYVRYLQMTDWKDLVPADKTCLNIIRKQVSKILPAEFKKLVRKAIAFA